MSNLALFVAGVVITIPAAVSIVGIMVAAMADGREEDASRAERARLELAAPPPTVGG